MKANFFRSTPLAPAFEAAGLAALDVGSRGGFDPDLLPVAWAVDGIGFEPEPAAFAELQTRPTTPWRSLRWLPAALGASTGPAILHVPTDPIAASLLPHDPEVGRAFGMEHLTDRRADIPVETVTLDEAAARWNIPPCAYVKLDVEGAELAILQGGAGMLATTLALKAEAAFLPMRVGQPLACDLVAFMAEQGFFLADLLHPAHWRIGPRPPHPYVAAKAPAYSRGRLVQCDLLFLRDPATIPMDDGATTARAALVAAAMGFFDHARSLCARGAARSWLSGIGVEGDAALASSSRSYGRRVALEEVRRRLRDLIPLLRSAAGGLPG